MKFKISKYANNLQGVFSSAVITTYSWSLLIFFWDMPSFLLRYNTGEIIGYAAYQLMFALAESVSVTFFVAMLSLILPAKYLRNNLRLSGTVLVFAFAINAIVFKNLDALYNLATSYFSISPLTAIQLVTGTWAVSLIALPIGLVMASKNNKFERGIKYFVEQSSILVSLYVILSVLGILLVIIRNIN